MIALSEAEGSTAITPRRQFRDRCTAPARPLSPHLLPPLSPPLRERKSARRSWGGLPPRLWTRGPDLHSSRSLQPGMLTTLRRTPPQLAPGVWHVSQNPSRSANSNPPVNMPLLPLPLPKDFVCRTRVVFVFWAELSWVRVGVQTPPDKQWDKGRFFRNNFFFFCGNFQRQNAGIRISPAWGSRR